MMAYSSVLTLDVQPGNQTVHGLRGPMNCPACGHPLSPFSRFCTHCGRSVAAPSSATEDMNLPVLYAMVALLILAGLCPPWESAPGQPPEFLGFHFLVGGADTSGGVVSRLLLTIELVTIAAGGLYGSWLLRKKPRN